MGSLWTMDGKVLVDADGHPLVCDVCPCPGVSSVSVPPTAPKIPHDCNLCENGTDLADTILADLGLGGWTDGSCNNCDQVKGVYTLPFCQADSLCGGTVCRWHYSQDDICTGDALWMYVEQIADGAMNYKWSFTVVLAAADRPPVCCESVTWLSGSTANYRSESLLRSANCRPTGNTLTLTKFSERHAYGICAGTLPATITLNFPE